MKRNQSKSLNLAIGAAVVVGLAGFGAVAADNPFTLKSLEGGYKIANAGEGKCGQGKCGGARTAKGAQGKCGMAMGDANNDGRVSKEEFAKHHAAIFDALDANKDGVLDSSEMGMGAMQGKAMQGKCGQGKCGGAR